MEDVLNPVLNDLKSGIPVLFTGTPCQTAAVLSFLGRDYDNLYLVDLICTGVPPQKLLWEHLGLMPDALCNISFRGCGGSRLKASGPDGELYKKPYYKDHFLMGFREHLYLRESCYSCPFASNERASDITIGDFWGLGKNEPFKHDITDGVSVVFPHSQKGEELIKMCRDRIFLEERELSEAVLGNPRFNIPSDKHKNYDLFRRCYKRKGFRYAFKKSMRKERFDYFIDGRIGSLKRFLKSL